MDHTATRPCRVSYAPLSDPRIANSCLGQHPYGHAREDVSYSLVNCFMLLIVVVSCFRGKINMLSMNATKTESKPMGPTGPTNLAELYQWKKDWYDWLPERKFIISNFLPSCTGKTLNVGVHDFNKYDEVAVPTGEWYETIDIDERCVDYGSTQRHTTVDLLDYTPEYRFDNIILFGVLGIYDGCGGYRYTLHANEDNLIRKVDQLLKPGGRVLLGPDVNPNSGAGKGSYSTVTYWNDLVNNHPVFKDGYTQEVNVKGRSNMVIIMKKNI